MSDHSGKAAATSDELVQLLLPDLSEAVVRRVLGRSAYSREEEREAEILASLLLRFGGWDQAPPAPLVRPELAKAVEEIEAALQPRWRIGPR